MAKPKLEMVVPYKEYKLVRGDGTVLERTKKHPFCMSRVHYSATGQSIRLPLSQLQCAQVLTNVFGEASPRTLGIANPGLCYCCVDQACRQEG